VTALDFGSVVLGGNVFGWTVDREDGFRILDAFLDGGGRALDTADVYTEWAPGNPGGVSESILGDWFASRGRRDEVVLISKVGAAAARPGLSAANIEAAVEDSLRRLRTDRIDLYLAHRDDPSTPQEETLAAFDRLIRAGKVREIGASNFSPARLRSAAATAEAAGLTPFTVAQDLWNLVERGAEVELVGEVGRLGLVELPYASLAGGFLTGKYRPGTVTDSVRAKRAGGYLDDPRHLDLLAALDDVAADHGVPVAAVAIAWLAAQRTVAAPLASARTLEQLDAVLAAGRVRLTPEDVVQLSATTEPVSA